MFSTHRLTHFNFSITFILSSAIAFNLDQSKILSFGNAGVAFDKGADERNDFEKNKQSVMYDEQKRAKKAKD